MTDNEAPDLEFEDSLDIAPPEVQVAPALPPNWRGRLLDLTPAALAAFWSDSLLFARWEIAHYACWRGQDEPVLPDGFDAEAVVQAAFRRLMQRDAATVPIFYTPDHIRHDLRMLIKHRIRWLHEKSETRLNISEWDVLPPRPDGERISIFDYLPGRIESPDKQAIKNEKEALLAQFKTAFEASLGKKNQLLHVFRKIWDGQKRRDIARALGTGVRRVTALQKQLKRRLIHFAASARGALAEMLQGLKEGE